MGSKKCKGIGNYRFRLLKSTRRRIAFTIVNALKRFADYRDDRASSDLAISK